MVAVEVVVVVGGEVAAMACGRWLWKACGSKNTPAVLPSVVVCGRLTLLSYSKIFLLHHDPPLHTDWPTPGRSLAPSQNLLVHTLIQGPT